MATDPIPVPPAPQQPALGEPIGTAANQADPLEIHPAWNWRTALAVCGVLLVVGVSADLDWVWLVALSVGVLAFIGSSTALRSDSQKGPGARFALLLVCAVVVTTIVVWIIWLVLELDFAATAGLVGGCLVILAAIPMAQRRIAASS